MASKAQYRRMPSKVASGGSKWRKLVEKGSKLRRGTSRGQQRARGRDDNA